MYGSSANDYPTEYPPVVPPAEDKEADREEDTVEGNDDKGTSDEENEEQIIKVPTTSRTLNTKQGK